MAFATAVTESNQHVVDAGDEPGRVRDAVGDGVRERRDVNVTVPPASATVPFVALPTAVSDRRPDR